MRFCELCGGLKTTNKCLCKKYKCISSEKEEGFEHARNHAAAAEKFAHEIDKIDYLIANGDRTIVTVSDGETVKKFRIHGYFEPVYFSRELSTEEIERLEGKSRKD